MRHPLLDVSGHSLLKYDNKSTKIKGFSPRVFWAFPLGWKVECFKCSTIKWPKRSAQNKAYLATSNNVLCKFFALID